MLPTLEIENWISVAAGIYQNTIFGLAAKLPFKHIGAVLLGSVSLLKILSELSKVDTRNLLFVSEFKWDHCFIDQYHIFGNVTKSQNGRHLLFHYCSIHSACLFWYILCTSVKCKYNFFCKKRILFYFFFWSEYY